MIGAKRYKPLLISCLALVFSITAASIVVSARSGNTPDAASQVTQNTDKANQQTTSLNGLQQKSTKTDDQAASSSPTTSTDPSNADKQTGTSNNTNQQAPAFDVTLNTSTVSLSADNAGAAIFVTITNRPETLQWSITPDTASGVTATVEQAKDKSGNATVRLHADTVAAGTYTFTVTAKDLARNTSVSKTITVTVN